MSYDIVYFLRVYFGGEIINTYLCVVNTQYVHWEKY